MRSSLILKDFNLVKYKIIPDKSSENEQRMKKIPSFVAYLEFLTRSDW